MSDAPVDPSDSEHLTVLEALGAKLGTAPKLSLKDETSGHGRGPVLKPASDETREALPKGKGNYHLMGELARGGMGIVIKAHDDDLGRDVALKVLHEELTEDPAILARFVEEAQIGGQLQHPGIVPVYELGLMADERPFFTMKLVKGRTLSALLKDRDELTQDRRRFLTIFEQVCQTIAYAHSRDVIHRDLKPSNVMVGAFGEVQVVDWGLAKVMSRSGDGSDERSAVSQLSTIETVRSGSSTTASDSVAGAVMGTPAYMPPEQARGDLEDLGEAADVFALGGLLCQILTGEPPYPGSKDQALARARGGDQTELTERLSQCGADRELVDLARECLAPAPANRPKNAGKVSERIQAHLASLEDRARRAEVRAARTLGLATSVVVTLAVASGAWLWISGERADRRQDELAQEAERKRIEVAQETELERLEQSRLAERRRETEGRVYAALSEANFARGQKDWPSAKAAVARARRFLEDAPDEELAKSVDHEAQRVAKAERLATEESERAEQLARFLDGMERNRGDFWVISNPQHRLEAYGRAFEEFGIDLTYLSEEELVGASQESGRAAEIALALDDLAIFNMAASTGGGPRILGLAIAMDPDPDRRALRTAASASDWDQVNALALEVEAREPSPVTVMALARGMRGVGDRDACIRILLESARRHPADASARILLGELLLGRDPMGALMHLSVALGIQPDNSYVHQLLGRVHRELGDLEEATRLLRIAVAQQPDEPQNHIQLGLTLRVQGDEAGAIESLDAASEIDPGSLEEFVNTNARASSQLYDSGRYEQSAWHARRALEMNEEAETALDQLGVSLAASKLDNDAIDVYLKLIAINPEHGNANNSMGNSLQALGRIEEAIQSYRRQITINKNHQFAHNNLGGVLWTLGDYAAAIECFTTGIEIRPSDPQDRCRLASVYFHQGDYALALETYRGARALDSEYCYSLSELAWFLTNVPDPEFRDTALALQLAKKATANHTDQPVYGNIHGPEMHVFDLGQAYYRAGRFEECVATLTRALELSQQVPGPDSCFFLAMAHSKLGEPSEASKWYDAGLQWMKSNQMTVPTETNSSRWRDEAQTVLGE